MVYTEWCRNVAACAASLVLLLVAGQAANAAGPVQFTYGPERALPALPTPSIGAQGVAADSAGDAYAIDGNRVLELPPGASRMGAQRVLPLTGLSAPRGLAADSQGDLFVADTGNRRVLELSAGSSTARVLPFIGLQGPNGVAIDAAGNVYVADTHGVVELPAGGSSEVALPFGEIFPTGVAVDSHEHVYAADGGDAGEVLELAPGTSSPTTVPALHGRVVAVGSHDELYVGGNDGVEEFPPPPGSAFPDSPLPIAGVSDVTGLAATAGGLYVSDLGAHAVFSVTAGSGAESLLPFTGTALGSPTALAVDDRGNLLELLDGRLVVLPLPSADPATARLAPIFAQASGLAVDPAGAAYVIVQDDSTLPTILKWPVGAPSAVTAYQQNSRLVQVAVDARGDLFWTETHQGPFADLGGAFELTPGASDARTLPFQSLHGPAYLAVSPGGDAYVSSAGTVGVVRAGAPTSTLEPLAGGIGELAVDPQDGVYGLTGDSVVMLPAGACQADQVELPLTGLSNPQGLAVDERGDTFVADTDHHRVVLLPATGTQPVPACPLMLSRFALHDALKGHPTLAFGLAAADPRSIKRIEITLPSGRLRFAHGQTMRRGLRMRVNGRARRLPPARGHRAAFRVRSLGPKLVITLRHAAGHVTVSLGRGAVYVSDKPPGFILYLGSTAIDVTGASGRTIPLEVPVREP